MRCQSRGRHQQRSWLVESLIDTLMAQVRHRIVGVRSSEMPADLFRVPPLRQQLRDRIEQLRVDVDPPAMVAGTPADGLSEGLVWSICTGNGAVALEFAVDRRRCPVQLCSNLRNSDTVST